MHFDSLSKTDHFANLLDARVPSICVSYPRLRPHAHMTSGRYFRRADSVESIATHLPVPRSNASLKILSPSVSLICPPLSSFFLDRIYKIVFKQVEQEIQESLSPKSAFGGVWGTTPVFLLSLLFSMLKHHLLYLLFFTLKILSILLILLILSKKPLRRTAQEFPHWQRISSRLGSARRDG